MAHDTTGPSVSDLLASVDAGELGWLDRLDPQRKGRVWEMRCPSCDKREAYHFPGSTTVICRREKNCGERVSVWDLLCEQHTSASRREIYQMIAEAAGVPLVRRDRPHARYTSTVFGWLRQALERGGDGWDYLVQHRKYSAADIAATELGYYPSARWLKACLDKHEMPASLAREWGLLPVEGDGHGPFARRVVGRWPQEDGSLRLWGRSISDDGRPKYHYASGLSKTRPYLFARPGGNTLPLCEGPLDANALRLMGIPGCAVGGVALIDAQAVYLQKQGVQSILFFTDDGDAARKGMLRTVAAAEPRGIATFFAISPEGSDDVDKLRENGALDTVSQMVADAISGGAILAEQIASLEQGSHDAYVRTRDYLPAIAQLTSSSRIAFDGYLRRQNLTPPKPEVEALRSVASLMDEGVSLDDAVALAERRYGIRVRFE